MAAILPSSNPVLGATVVVVVEVVDVVVVEVDIVVVDASRYIALTKVVPVLAGVPLSIAKRVNLI